MPAANVIQLRQLLSEKFPQLRLRAKSIGDSADAWPTGLNQIDDACGGLLKSAITEIVSGERCCGSATLMRALLCRAAVENQLITVIDGGDSLDVTQIDPAVLARTLWVRCRSAEEALKAADLVLRDNNLSLVFLDLASNLPAQLRRISPTVWYRFQRLLENASTVCAVFTPRPMINPAALRVTLKSTLSMDSLEKDSTEILRAMEMDISNAQHAHKNARLNLAG